MPNCQIHTQAGGISSAVFAAYHARNEPPMHQFVEILGGIIGGVVGGRLPDIIEPATSPCHRNVAHSWGTLAVVGALTFEDWRRECRTRANVYQNTLDISTLSENERNSLILGQLFWRLTAGICAGIQVGYISHLILDSCTPKGLPLFAR